MIILGTHVWVWWVDQSPRLRPAQITAIFAQEDDDSGVIGVCATTLWEIAMLVQHGRLELSSDLSDWFGYALAYPRVRIINLTPAIAIQSTNNLMDSAQSNRANRITDPSDQIIVATAMVSNCPLVTSDGQIIAYSNVRTIH